MIPFNTLPLIILDQQCPRIPLNQAIKKLLTMKIKLLNENPTKRLEENCLIKPMKKTEVWKSGAVSTARKALKALWCEK
jgi:hypothetical protein